MNRFLITACMLAAICVFSLLASGCAGERSISPGYQPVGLQKAAAPLGVAVMKFADGRTDKTIGQMAGAFGTKASLVLPKDADAGQWVAGAVAAELSQAGLQVTPGTIPPGTTVRVFGKVMEIHVRMNAEMKAKVGTDVIVSKDGIAVLARQYTGQSSVAASADPSVDDYQQALEAALQDAMKKAVPDILTAIQ